MASSSAESATLKSRPVSNALSARLPPPGVARMGRYFVADRLSVRCHRCGQVGHRVQECTNAAVRGGLALSAAQRPLTPSPQLAHPCFMCGGINHEAYRCPDQLCHRCNRPGGWRARHCGPGALHLTPGSLRQGTRRETAGKSLPRGRVWTDTGIGRWCGAQQSAPPPRHGQPAFPSPSGAADAGGGGGKGPNGKGAVPPVRRGRPRLLRVRAAGGGARCVAPLPLALRAPLRPDPGSRPCTWPAPLYCARCGRQGHLYGECDGGRGGRSSGGPARARRRGTHQRFDSSDDSTVDGRDMRAKGARAAPARRHSSPRGGARPKPGVWGGNDGAEVTYVGASDSESGTSPEAGTGAGADPDPYASSSDEGGTGFFVQEERPHPSRGRGRGRGNRPAGAGGRGRGRGGGRGRQDRRGGGPDRRGSPGQPRRRSHHGSGQGGPATGGRGRGRGGGRSSGGGEDRSSRKRWRQSSSDADRSSRKRGGGGRG